MNSLLIGSTGFLGKSLEDHFSFTESISSNTPLKSKHFELAVCAAPSAKKWLAFQKPSEDLANVEGLISRLESFTADKFILLSTVDVYKNPQNSNEGSALCGPENPYGFNRQKLERFVLSNFPKSLVLRLSGLVGKHLVKNPVFDLKNQNEVYKLSANSSMQFLPIENLATFIQFAIDEDLQGTINLCAEPIELGLIGELAGTKLVPTVLPAKYDVTSQRLLELFGTEYLVSRTKSIEAIRNYFVEP